MDRHKRIYLATQAALLALFLACVAYVSFRYAPQITRLISHPERFREYLLAYGPVSALIYIFVVAMHIVIIVIPGEIVQMAGGYAFGTALGAFYAMIGTVIGTVIVFAATRLLGLSLVKALVPPKTFARFEFLINRPKSEIALFFLFLIPGIPKDTLVYLSGLTPIKPLRFLLICTIARFPGVLGSAYIGAHLQKKEYLRVWIMFGIATLLFALGILLRDKIISRVHHQLKKDPPAAV